MKVTKNLLLLYYTSCAACTVVAIAWCIYKYSLDEDATKVETARFHSLKGRLYPAVTMCLGGTTAFEGGRFHNFDSNKNGTSNDDDLANKPLLRNKYYQIGQTENTLDINQYISKVTIKDFQNNAIHYTNGVKEENATVKRLISNVVIRRYGNGNCFAIGIPFIKNNEINSIQIRVKKGIFMDGLIPQNEKMISGESKFSLGLSYQNSFFPLLRGGQGFMPLSYYKQNALQCYGLVFTIRKIEILTLRNKPMDRCNNFEPADGTQMLVASVRIGRLHRRFPSARNCVRP